MNASSVYAEASLSSAFLLLLVSIMAQTDNRPLSLLLEYLWVHVQDLIFVHENEYMFADHMWSMANRCSSTFSKENKYFLYQ